MTVIHSLISNTIWRSAADFISRLTSAVFWIMVARYLGANALGSIAFAISLFSFFELVSSLGLGSVVTRDVAKDKNIAAAYYGHSLSIAVLSSIVFTIIMVATAMSIQPHSETVANTKIMAVALPIAGIFYFSRALLISAEKMLFVTLASFTENIFQLAAGWLLLVRGYGVHEIVWVLVTGKTLACMVIVFYAGTKVAKPDWRLKKPLIKYLFQQMPSFLLIAVLNAFFWSVAIIMLTKLRGEEQAGYFSAAFKLVSFFLMFAIAYGQALFPVASKLTKESIDPGLYAKLLRKSLKFIFTFSLATAAGLSLLSRQIVLMLFGPELINAAPVLRWLAWLLVPYAAIPALAFTLVSNHLQRKDLLANFAGALVLISSLFLLVPRWGAIGAAMAMLAGSLVFFVVEYISVHRLLFSLSIGLKNLWPIAGVGLMSLCVFCLQKTNLYLSVFVGIVIYFLFLYLTRSLKIRELRLLRSLVLREPFGDGIL